ncbi:hypothetical protein PPL_01607 [Heterostelium album PN500]|uniref:CCR4-NOT transcription complex subunit 11 n=1 Tax=Heterostelium pallidum (strain ATCC 26659 / Pp 5 / PN500) TaxID=670386 RepID=D3AZZ3_HETP5|nr:hypothetical protein PPL_01607 [Heterostelium album PN500]EFA84617.1 hypothetical protein PPL_01607 [Heterostelium album PN500]|eukprot:XP_020436730.1 hypothetical protein PPL_01607 [Heterostelium album PN500]
MISAKDLVTLLSLLSEEDKPLETVSTTFNRTFNKNDHFKTGCAIYTMLKDGFIRVPSHRLNSFYILYSLYKHDHPTIQQYQSITSSQSNSSSSLTDNSNSNNTDSSDNNSGSNNNNNSNNNSIDTSSSSSSPSTTTTNPLSEYPIVFNPFLPVFIDELEKHQNQQQQQQQHASKYLTPVERQYLIQFLTHLPKDFSKKTPNEVEQQTVNSELTTPDLNEYRKFYLERLAHHSFPSLRSIGVSPTLFFPEQQQQQQQQQQHQQTIPPAQQQTNTSSSSSTSSVSPKINSKHNKNSNNKDNSSSSSNNSNNNSNSIQDINIQSKELSLFSFEPNFNRPPPPLYEHTNMIWINTTITHGLLLSPTMGFTSVTNPKRLVRDLMSKAIRGRLKKTQIQQIKAELDADPKLVLYSGLVPKKLPNLVENNTQVAIDALLKLIHSPDFKDYFQELISMEMNYRSMEVVNALATSVELPSHFIPMYISNCITTCNNSKDKAMLQRSVRLVCVFIQSLIRNNIINIKDLFAEVQAFCLEHAKIREAIGLFKLMTEEKNNGN